MLEDYLKYSRHIIIIVDQQLKSYDHNAYTYPN